MNKSMLISGVLCAVSVTTGCVYATYNLVVTPVMLK